MKEMKFKTGQEVLVRDSKVSCWEYGVYSHYNKSCLRHRVNSLGWIYCIPYKGNEHLVGTTDKPKEEEDLPINTPVMCKDEDDTIWAFRYYAKHGLVYINGYKSNGIKQTIYYDIIIPVDKFDFNNPDNSLKYNIVK